MNEKVEDLNAERKRLLNCMADLDAKNREANRIIKEIKTKLEKKEAMEDEQLAIVSKDFDNALRRAEVAESEVTSLKDEIKRLRGETIVNSINTNVNDHETISKDKQIQELLEENKSLCAKLDDQAVEFRSQIKELTEKLERYTQHVEQLEYKLRSQSDYENLKKELRTLRSVQFGEELEWNNEDLSSSDLIMAATATANVQTGGQLRPLDELLIEKNHFLQSENVEQRMKRQDAEDRLKVAEHIILELTDKKERLQSVISRLENDLINFQTIIVRSPADGADRNDLNELSTEGMLAKELSGTNDSSSTVNVDNNILSIVTSQRNRLRMKLEEKERQFEDCIEKNSLLSSEIEKIRQDNVNLYGKIKFLQTYQNKIYQKKANESTRLDAETRYENEYEQHLDPFRNFNIEERQRKYTQLRVHDKAALTLGRCMMSSVQSRTFFLLYLLVLHLLTFLVLYRFAYTEASTRDFQAECIANFHQHMHNFHPGDPSFAG